MITWPTRHSPGEPIDRQQPIPANILLVDDRPETQAVLARMLTGPGLKLVHVRTGQIALNWLAEGHSCALILIAAQTAHLDGFELAWLIKENPTTQSIPLMFLAEPDLSHAEMTAGYALGAIVYLVEPLKPNAVINKVNTLVELYRKNVQLADTTACLQAQDKH
jgi:response regulator RpfG family c-di-GMP phosphodiesterase